MSHTYSARASFHTYFYWCIFVVTAVLVVLFVERMIQLAGAEDESYGMMSVASYRQQADLYREMRELREEDAQGSTTTSHP